MGSAEGVARKPLGDEDLAYVAARGIEAETVRHAGVWWQGGAFSYPCRDLDGMVLGVHSKSRARDANGRRKQWWGDYAANLLARGNGKQPGDPARVVPFGMEVLGDLDPGSLVVLCCGEEDALTRLRDERRLHCAL